VSNYGESIFEITNAQEANILNLTLCTFEGNVASDSLIRSTSLSISQNSVAYLFNQGRLLYGFEMSSMETEIYIENHQCLETNDEGCIKYLESGSIQMANFNVNSLKSNLILDSIVGINAIFSIDNLTLANIETTSSFSLFYMINCSLTIQNTDLGGLNKNIIFMNSFSSLFIFNSTFSELISEFVEITSFFECVNCQRLIIQNVVVKECSTIIGTCFSFSLGNFSFHSKKINISGSLNSSNYLIKDNIFMDCQNIEGGVFLIIDQNVQLLNNSFLYNNASSGGALHFECPSKPNCNWNLTSNFCKKNQFYK